MSEKIYYTEGDRPESQMGAALESLAVTIHARREAGEKSYTYRLLRGSLDTLLKKIVEEAHETTLAAKDVSISTTLACMARADEPSIAEAMLAEREADMDHLRYEAADVVYHLLVMLERYGISLDEFAAELNSRMTEDELALRQGVAMLKPECINRGK